MSPMTTAGSTAATVTIPAIIARPTSSWRSTRQTKTMKHKKATIATDPTPAPRPITAPVPATPRRFRAGLFVLSGKEQKKYTQNDAEHESIHVG